MNWNWIIVGIYNILFQEDFLLEDSGEVNKRADEMRMNGQLYEADKMIEDYQEKYNKRQGCVFWPVLILLILFILFS